MKLDLNALGETALLTLFVRAKDYESSDSVLHDKKSWELYKQIDFDFDQFKTAWISYYGVLGRARVIDRKITEFISSNPDGVIVSLGAGLDTVFYRVDNGHIDWYNIDFPEVIEARSRFFETHERVHDIAASMLDTAWTEHIDVGKRKLLLVSEGVVMYFSLEDMSKFLRILTDSFSEFTLYLDMISPYVAKHTHRHDMLSKMNVSFQWGTKDGHEIIAMNPKLEQIDCINFTHSMMSLVPGIRKLIYPVIYFTNNRLGIYEYKQR